MKILVIKLSSLGDALHALPAVCAIKKHFNAEIDWAVQPQFSSLVKCFDCVDSVIEIPRPSKFIPYLKSLKALSKKQYDLVIDFQGLMKSALVAFAAKAPKKIGPSFARELSPIFYTELAGKKNKNRHAIDECMDILDNLSIPRPTEAEFSLRGNVYTLPQLNEDKPTIAIAPVSRWESKNWDIDSFHNLVEEIIKQYQANVYVIGGKNDIDIGNRICDNTSAINLCGKTSIAETLEILKQSDILISNDSGPMHMSVATQTMCIALFGPTSSLRTGPYGNKNVVIQANLPCIPCRKKVCPLGTHQCMKSITVEMVLSHISKILNK